MAWRSVRALLIVATCTTPVSAGVAPARTGRGWRDPPSPGVQDPLPRHHWPLARNGSDVAALRNDMVCQHYPGYPCPTYNTTPGVFPGQASAASFPVGPAFPDPRWWKGGIGLRTATPVTLTKDKAFTVWWRTTYLPPAPPQFPVDQAQIFGATSDSTAQAWYVTFWNASQGTLPPEACGPGTSLPVCGPLLSIVFAAQPGQFIQYCTDPRTFDVAVNATHFLGFSASGTDNKTFVFFFDGVDRTKDLVLCTSRGDPAKNDPSGPSVTHYKSKWRQNLDFEMCFVPSTYRCRGSQPNHASNPEQK